MSKLFGSLVPEMNNKRKLVTRILEEETSAPYYDIPIYCKEAIEPKYETINKIGRVKLTEGLELDVYGNFEQPWFLGMDIVKLLGLDNNSGAGRAFENVLNDFKHKFIYECDLSNKQVTSRKTQNGIFINEAGIYSKFSSSNKKEAKTYMKSIYNTLSSIRKQTGNLVFTEDSFNQIEKINNMFRDSRVGRTKVEELLLEETGISYSGENDYVSFNKLLEDMKFVELDDESDIKSYDHKFIKCTRLGNINKTYYALEYFKYEGIKAIYQYINKNKESIKEID